MPKNFLILSMKILITSDNHLGFKEMDPARSEDSFITFEEVLSLARQEDVDFILQGGDLFHESKPSRYTYNRTLQILRKYCLGERRPSLESNIPLNFSNPNIKISLPIFSIHGNHDDPSGFSNISPLDVLHSGGLINYFGKVDNVDNIELQPILIEKDRKVAIFGLGHIKDRRLYKTFLKGNVRYKRPAGEDWFNILMVHQNRVPRKEEYLPEDFIDPFFDLVIYGHEHESVVIKYKNFDIIQCGSSIRTSLCEGERPDKYVYILELFEKPRIRGIILKTVRPLIVESVKITDGDPEMQVKHKIEEMMHNAKSHAANYGCVLPLVRLNVELGGLPGFNRNRIFPFLQKHMANPSDSLKIIRRTEKVSQKPARTIQKNKVDDIYKEILHNVNFKTLFQLNVMDSLRDFVEKDSKEAFTTMIKDSVADIVNNIDLESIVADGIEDAIKMARDTLDKKNNDAGEFDGISEDQDKFSSGNESKIALQSEEPCDKDTHLRHESALTLGFENDETASNGNTKKPKTAEPSDNDIFTFSEYF